MRWIWRAFAAALLLGAPAVWLPIATPVAASLEAAGSARRAPVADENDNNDNEDRSICFSDNPRKRKKCHYNGWDNDLLATGAPQSNGELSVALWRSTETPVEDTSLVIAVTGAGAPIDRLWWWVEGPDDDRRDDDLAHRGERHYECGGAQPCTFGWTVWPRHDGVYTLHVRVRDTSGREVQTDWTFYASDD